MNTKRGLDIIETITPSPGNLSLSTHRTSRGIPESVFRQKLLSLFKDDINTSDPRLKWHPGATIKGNKEYLINSYEVGGFGIIYYVSVLPEGDEKVLKTPILNGKSIDKISLIKQFKKEADRWIAIERHPYIAEANWYEEINGIPFIGMEQYYGNFSGLTLDEIPLIVFGIRFCSGMNFLIPEHIIAHCDIKPTNVLADHLGNPRITDFGISKSSPPHTSRTAHRKTLETKQRNLTNPGKDNIVGTPQYMSPEQFNANKNVDSRSDIYSFGIMLFELYTGRPPFIRCSFDEYRSSHEKDIIRYPYDMNSEIKRIITKCVNKDPSKRYNGFEPLEKELRRLFKTMTGDAYLDDFDSQDLKNKYQNKYWYWANRGASEFNRGRMRDSVECSDKALNIYDKDAMVWANKGSALINLERYDEAMYCLETAIRLKPNYANSYIIYGKLLHQVGRFQSALECFNKALTLDPDNYIALNNKGAALLDLGRIDEGIGYIDMAINKNIEYSDAWFNKATIISKLNKKEESLNYYEKALEFNPNHSSAWFNKANALKALQRYEEAIQCYLNCVQSDPRYKLSYFNLANTYCILGMRDLAINSYNNAIAIDQFYLKALAYKYLLLTDMGRNGEAQECLQQAIRINRNELQTILEESYMNKVKFHLD